MKAPVQYLRQGKALCKAVFPRFVETFNHLVDFAVNLKGDADTFVSTGHVKVDRTDPSNPVIRCTGCASDMKVKTAQGSGLYLDDKDALDLVGRSRGGEGEEADEFAVRKFKVKSAAESDVETAFFAADDITVHKGVTELNGTDGPMHVVGGESIKVETRDGNIVISYEQGKRPDPEPDPDPDPDDPTSDPCAHDDYGGGHGGVDPNKEPAPPGGGGGVNPDKDDPAKPHPGDDNCQGDPNCNC